MNTGSKTLFRGPVEQRLVDVAFGLSAVHWGLGTLLGEHGASMVGGTLGALNLAAACLFLFRKAPTREVDVGACTICLLSVFAGGVALKLAPAYDRWPPFAAALFFASGVAAIGSLLVLGRSFAVLPSFRKVVTSGPFRWIRHPVYLAESTMVLASGLAAATWAGALAASGAIALVVWRIRIEERLLLVEPTYQAYAAQVKWRLVPLIW